MDPSDASTALAEFPIIVAIPVLWADQDAMGHVNNTAPIRWFESARIAYLEKVGMLHVTRDQRLGPILASTTCNYRRQLHYPDTVHVAARVSKIGNSSLHMQHQIYSEAVGSVAADGESVMVVFDYGEQKTIRVPDALRAAIGAFEGMRFS